MHASEVCASHTFQIPHMYELDIHDAAELACLWTAVEALYRPSA